MDLFLRDVFDVAPRGSWELDEGELDMARMIRSPALTSSLAFHEAWRAAMNGTRPTRLDVAEFARRLGSPDAWDDKGAKWDAHVEKSLVDTLIEWTPLRIHPQAEKLVKSAVDAYRAALASSSSSSARLAMLSAKWNDRFGHLHSETMAMPPTLLGLASAYATRVMSDPMLKHLEAWAAWKKNPNEEEDRPPPKSVREYYRRVNAAADVLNLPFEDPLTGRRVQEKVADVPPLSCVELVRFAMSRDGYLWRQDLGGGLLIPGRLPPDAYAKTEGFPFRTAPPGLHADLALAALPRILYGRVAATVATIAIATSNDSFDLVKIDAVSLTIARGKQAVSYWIPSTLGRPFGCPDAHPPGWAEPMRRSMLASHLRLPCPFAQPQGGDLLLHRFVATYASKRRLGSKVFLTADANEGGRVGEVVLIDTRRNVWSAMAVLITLDNLDARDWSVSVFCADRNLEFMRSCLSQVPHARVEALPELSKESGAAAVSFDVETYNDLLKSPSFWARTRAPRVLVVQDDGMIVRRGLEEDVELMAQDYVGAPWADTPPNRTMLQAAGVRTELVGNGGLSLRRTEAMKRACELGRSTGADRRLFNHNLQPVPEDVFFASSTTCVLECPRTVAARFSFEQTEPTSNTVPPPLGFHKPWAYLPVAHVDAYFEDVLSSLA